MKHVLILIAVAFLSLSMAGCRSTYNPFLSPEERDILRKEKEEQKLDEAKEERQERGREGADAIKRVAEEELPPESTGTKKIKRLADGTSTALGPPKHPIEIDEESITEWERKVNVSVIEERETVDGIMWKRFQTRLSRGGSKKFTVLLFLAVGLVAFWLWVRIQYPLLSKPVGLACICILGGFVWYGFQDEIQMGAKILAVMCIAAVIFSLMRKDSKLRGLLSKIGIVIGSTAEEDPEVAIKINEKIDQELSEKEKKRLQKEGLILREENGD